MEMKTTIVLLIFALFLAISLAQMQMKTPNNSNRTPYIMRDDTTTLLHYHRIENILKRTTMDKLKSVGYKVSAIRETLKVAIAAKKAITTCYTNKSIEEFNNCAMDEIEKARIEFEAVQGNVQDKPQTTLRPSLLFKIPVG